MGWVGRSAPVCWPGVNAIFAYWPCHYTRSAGRHQFKYMGMHINNLPTFRPTRSMPSLGSGPVNRINTPFRAVIITLLDRHKPAYLSMSRIYHITTYFHGDVPVGGQVGGSAPI